MSEAGDIIIFNDSVSFISNLKLNATGSVFISQELNSTGSIHIIANSDCLRDHENITMSDNSKIYSKNSGWIKLWGGDIHIESSSKHFFNFSIRTVSTFLLIEMGNLTKIKWQTIMKNEIIMPYGCKVCVTKCSKRSSSLHKYRNAESYH